MFKPIPLDLPPCELNLKKIDNKIYFFDILRKKNIVLTPEEWVRQHWIHFLFEQKNYPKTLMHIEGGMTLNGLQKRTDLVIYNNKGEKIIMAEFKAPNVNISQKTFEQVGQYNIIHKIPLLMVSNGLKHFFCQIDFEKKNYKFVEDLPDYSNL